MNYSFCEPWTASSRSRWHIRQLTEVGHKFSGGADTSSLCGRPMSWDIRVPITAQHLSHSCPKCAEIFKEVQSNDS